MYAWDKRRTGKKRTICVICGGKIYWMDNIGTCTGACSQKETTKHKSAKAICNELAYIKTKIVEIGKEIDSCNEACSIAKRLEELGDYSSRNHIRKHETIMWKFEYVIRNPNLRKIIQNALLEHLEKHYLELIGKEQELAKKHTELSNKKYRRM